MIRRAAAALLFVGMTVVLAKVCQYAAVERLAASIGFDAASLVGAAPVVIGATLLRRTRYRTSVTQPEQGGRRSSAKLSPARTEAAAIFRPGHEVIRQIEFGVTSGCAFRLVRKTFN